jgi:NAD(P)-dependent dehydrogenase (short-subunit alcohol dehydrogenase family)
MASELRNQVAAVAVADDELAKAIVARLEGAGARVHRIDQLAEDGTGAALPQLQQTVEAVVRGEGRLDIWVQSAHADDPRPATALDLLAWQHGLLRTIGAAFAGAQVAGRFMLPQGRGSIVLLTSVDGLLASAGRATACCGAAGVIMLAKALACEWAANGVRVNAVASTRWLAPPRDPGEVELTATGISPSRIPLGRPPRPTELAEAVVYLASSQASFVTGETLRVDGGWTGYHLF